MLVDNPLLTLLGRRGRGAVMEAFLRNPTRTWTVRELARFADVAPMVASRAVRELAALAMVDVVRPGRDARIRWRRDAAAAQFLEAAPPPDLRRAAADVFSANYAGPVGARRLLLWRDPADEPADPLTPTRIAIVVARNQDAALDAVGPALDAVRRGGLPAPDVALLTPADLAGEDATAVALRAGVPLS